MIRYTYDARGQMVAVYEDGTVVPVLGVETNAGMAQGSGGTGPAAPEAGADANGYAGGTGYARNSGYARNYTPRQPDFGTDYATEPAYADGSRHPAQGGQPRAAGGVFAQQATGGRGQQQVNVPGGAAAGPFSTRAAYPAGGASGSGGGASGGSGGGGGGSSLYWAWRNRLTGNLTPGSSSYGGYDSYKPPREKKEPMRGPYAHGLDPDQALGLSYRPNAMLGRSLPGLNDASGLDDLMRSLPSYQLGILSHRNYKGRPMDLANSIGRFQHAAGTTGDLPDFEDVFRNLTNPKKGGGIDDMFNGIKNSKAMQKATGYPYEYGHEPLTAADAGATFESLLGGALSLLPKETAAGLGAYGSSLIDKAVLKDMKKPAGKGRDIPKMVGRRIFR